MKNCIHILILMIAMPAVAYTPPIGIPEPDFGIDETYRMYDDVGNQNGDLDYRASDGGGYYTHYVDTDNGDDSGGNNYGTKSSPRKTFPSDTYILPGSVIELHGSATLSAGVVSCAAIGTSSQPIFIRGIVEGPLGVGMPLLTRTLRIWGGYIIVENLEFDKDNLGFQEAAVLIDTSSGTYDPNHIAVRACYGHGYEPADIRGTSMYAIGVSGHVVENIVWYNNKVALGSGNLPDDDEEYDDVCIGIQDYTDNIWILENDLSDCSGDCIASGHSANHTATHYYIGGNTLHDTGENAIDIKECQYVVISQNECYNFCGNSAGQVTGLGIVTHYGQHGASARDTWIIFNEIYNITGYKHANGGAGIQVGGTEDWPVYIIGNIVHDVQDLIVKEFWWNNYAVGTDTAALIQSRLVAGGFVDADGVVDPGFSGVDQDFKDLFDGAYPYFDEMDTRLTAVKNGGANGQAYMSWNCKEVYMLNNTFCGNDNGVTWDGYTATGQLVMYNNIISEVDSGGYHLAADTPYSNAEVENNLFYQSGSSVVIDWGGTPYDVAGLIANTTKGDNCLESDPTFTDEANDDYSLQAGSPAIDAGTDAGTVNTVYNLFLSTFGESIKVDWDGTTRTGDWDMGAYDQAGATGGAKHLFAKDKP